MVSRLSEEKRKDKNLWVIRAVERDVFDSKMVFDLHDGSENSTSNVNIRLIQAS
jgi:hypothetical protein